MTAAHQSVIHATDLAERALIGALLADPSRVRDVRDWLRPSALNQPKARTIYATLTELHRHGRTVPARELPVLIAAHDGDHPSITVGDGHAYLRATPAVSRQLGTQHLRSNHVFYAPRVLEASARRIVTVAGSRIAEATEHSRHHPHLGTSGLTAALAQTQARLAALGQRLRHAQGSPGALIAAALGGPIPDPPALDAAEIRSGSPVPPLTTRAILEAERDVLTACLTDPILRAELVGWLTPRDFSRPEHAATWAACQALTQAGTPVDCVTLAWECQRRHPDYDSPGLRADQLVTMAAHPPVLAGSAVATVAHAALLRYTDTARDQVQALADNRAADALTVVCAAEKAYRDVGHHARRLSGTPVSRISAALDPTNPVTQARTIPPARITTRPTTPATPPPRPVTINMSVGMPQAPDQPR